MSSHTISHSKQPLHLHPDHSENKWKQLADDLNLPVPLIRLMGVRGLTTPEDIKDFLYPKLADLPSPFLMKGMKEATRVFIETLRSNRPILIYGDYDVDGTSSTALLITFLRYLNITARWYLPNRLREGYGLHKDALKKLATKVTTPALLITVDCGINANEEVSLAKELGFKVIITDHHVPPTTLPEAEAILNPKQDDCSFPFKELAGVGVAFFYIVALRRMLVESGYWRRESAPNLKLFLDLVALGTIADVMPLVGVNRILVRAGLEVLSSRSRPGLWALCEQAGLPEGRITSEDISYRLAPRINAAGRMDNPDLSVNLLICKTSTKATEMAISLEDVNNERKKVAAEALKKAILLGKEQVKLNPGALVLTESWQNGIVGIVAAKLVDLYKLPVIIFGDDITENSDQLKGSARSVKGIDLYKVLTSCSEFIEKYGGHAMAAGLVIKKKRLSLFTKAINHQLLKITGSKGYGEDDPDHPVADYIPVNGDIFREKFLDSYLRLEPFGEGNPEPVFRLDNPPVHNISTIKDHLKFTLRQHNRNISGIGFFMGDKEKYLRRSPTIVFKLKNTTFRGVQRWEVHVINISDFSLHATG